MDPSTTTHDGVDSEMGVGTKTHEGSRVAGRSGGLFSHIGKSRSR